MDLGGDCAEDVVCFVAFLLVDGDFEGFEDFADSGELLFEFVGGFGSGGFVVFGFFVAEGFADVKGGGDVVGLLGEDDVEEH